MLESQALFTMASCLQGRGTEVESKNGALWGHAELITASGELLHQQIEAPDLFGDRACPGTVPFPLRSITASFLCSIVSIRQDSTKDTVTNGSYSIPKGLHLLELPPLPVFVRDLASELNLECWRAGRHQKLRTMGRRSEGVEGHTQSTDLWTSGRS